MMKCSINQGEPLYRMEAIFRFLANAYAAYRNIGKHHLRAKIWWGKWGRHGHDDAYWNIALSRESSDFRQVIFGQYKNDGHENDMILFRLLARGAGGPAAS